MGKADIPPSVRKIIWFADSKQLDLKCDQKTITTQVLNFGDFNAIAWLFCVYGKEKITVIANEIPIGAWNEKSLSLWKYYLNINPKSRQEDIK